MTDTLPRQAGAAEVAPPSSAASSRVDLGDLRVVHTRHWFRWSIGIVVLFVVAQFAWSLVTNENYEWDVFAHYFLSEPVLQGVGITLALTVISATIGFFLGTLLALARLAKSPLLNSAAWVFIWFFRSVPLVVQIIVWYNLGYLYPTLGLGTPFTTDFWIVEFPTVQLISAFAAAILGLSLNQAAYSAEIIRGGLLSVDQGQLEAAAALGIPPRRRLTRIVLPQAMRSIVPNATNEVIGLVKGASVVFVIAIPEVFYAVQVIYNRNSRVIPLLLVAVVWYTIITTILSIAQYYIERHYARGSVRVLPPTPVQRARHWIALQWARLGDADSSPPPLEGSDAAPLPTAAQHSNGNDAKFGGR
ncbi:amino acid ABC transporter permease [Microbacterium trichothecenolyticum]|uniref:Inner membrane amino-acid ABC transporter permease protein YecS n=1 Tax=Microbacterium trichothecenolyticum TaxID=69370 RepID=A0A0M2H8F9_MICTR|nr:amino acid ABC transporter permease [Microbacterium trichothecenolyticum]KJL40385.1 Inner membrane amino-acid ABC transporter permease protein YecS [Microbacterium trichothecenolyticum]